MYVTYILHVRDVYPTCAWRISYMCMTLYVKWRGGITSIFYFFLVVKASFTGKQNAIDSGMAND